MARTMNDEIKKIGIKYVGHYNVARVTVIGTAWRYDIPINRIGEFTRLFPDVEWEDGEFLESLAGRYLRVTVDDEMNLYAFHHITKSIDYMI